MKNRLLALAALLVLIALAAVLWPQNAISTSKSEPQTKETQTPLKPARLRHDLTHLMREPAHDELPFWKTAIVPEPETPRFPSAAAIRGKPSAPDAALKTAALIRELESSPATPENLLRYNQQAILYYDQDPTAATDWLNTTQGYSHLSPALASIAASLGERGHIDVAHLIVESITDEDARRRAVIDIYSLRARNGQVTREDLAQAGWDSADIEFIFQNKGD
jgi:hypothetical protein